MELIKEPFEIDFFVDPRPLTDEEKKKISEYIKLDKEKRKSKKNKEDLQKTTP